MRKQILVHIFFEDRCQERFITEIVKRIGKDIGLSIEIRSISVSKPGHGKGETYKDIKNQFLLIRKGNIFLKPDVMVISVDTNCEGYSETYKNAMENIDKQVVNHIIIACPYPHIEKWYLLDLECFNRIVGVTPIVPKEKCEKDFYKNVLKKAIRDGGYPYGVNPEDFAEDIAQAMDLYNAGKKDNSFKLFIDT